MNKQTAEALFATEAVYLGADVIPIHRVIELFGADIGAWIESHIGGNESTLAPGRHYNEYGWPCVTYLTLPGFMKIVEQVNYRTVLHAHAESNGGKCWDSLWEARQARIDAIDAEDERKRRERREKRAAARKAKQEAAVKEISA